METTTFDEVFVKQSECIKNQLSGILIFSLIIRRIISLAIILLDNAAVMILVTEVVTDNVIRMELNKWGY